MTVLLFGFFTAVVAGYGSNDALFTGRKRQVIGIYNHVQSFEMMVLFSFANIV